jgi:AmmeMemoRadiSam system protein B
MPAGSGVRAPAVVGQFYPADPDELRRLVDGLLAAVPVPVGEPAAAGYAVPHAGFRYSGPVAAHAYARLRFAAQPSAAAQPRACARPGAEMQEGVLRPGPGAEPARASGVAARPDAGAGPGRARPNGVAGVERVVLIGPAHYGRLFGCAVPAARVWRGPLGDVPIDGDTAHRLVVAGLASVDDEPFACEHSLEVQLPFLQRCLAPVPVLPVVAGISTVDEVAAVLAAAVEDSTLVLCSTDLSHYETDRVARQQDARTVKAVLDLTPERVGVRDACGVFALRGLLGWARREGLRARLLSLGTSADTFGDPQRVVGYGAFAFDRPSASPR